MDWQYVAFTTGIIFVNFIFFGYRKRNQFSNLIPIVIGVIVATFTYNLVFGMNAPFSQQRPESATPEYVYATNATTTRAGILQYDTNGQRYVFCDNTRCWKNERTWNNCTKLNEYEVACT